MLLLAAVGYAAQFGAQRAKLSGLAKTLDEIRQTDLADLLARQELRSEDLADIRDREDVHRGQLAEIFARLDALPCRDHGRRLEQIADLLRRPEEQAVLRRED